MSTTAEAPVEESAPFQMHECAVLTANELVTGLVTSVPALKAGELVVDTGCTSSLISAETEELWKTELAKLTPIAPIISKSNLRFRGIGGVISATHSVRWPTIIGGKLGTLTTSVVPTSVPPLLSGSAVRSLGGSIHLGPVPSLELSSLGGRIPMRYADNGHVILDVFQGFRQAPGTTGTPSSTSRQTSATQQSKAPIPRTNNFNQTKTKVNDESSQSAPLNSKSRSKLPKDVFSADRSENPLSVVRKLARETRGPWVSRERFDLILSLIESLVEGSDARILAANIAYRPRITRTLPAEFAKCCTHWMMLAITPGDDSQLIILPKKQWTSYMVNSHKEFNLRYPLVMTIFANIKPSVNAVSSQWKPDRKTQSEVAHVADALPELHAEEFDSSKCPVTSPIFSQPKHTGRTVSFGSEPVVVDISPPPGLDPVGFVASALSDSSHAQPLEGEVSSARRSSRDSPLQSGECQARRELSHEVVRLQQLPPSHHGRVGEHQQGDLLLRSTLFRNSGIRPLGGSNFSSRGQEGQGHASPVQGRLSRGQAASEVFSRRGNDPGTCQEHPSEGSGEQLLQPDSVHGSKGQGSATSFCASCCSAAVDEEGSSSCRSRGHGLRFRERFYDVAADRAVGRSSISLASPAEPEPATTAPLRVISDPAAATNDLVGSECFVSVNCLQKQVYQGNLATAPSEEAHSVEPCYCKVAVSRAVLAEFLGPTQQHLLDEDIFLVEVFAGKSAELSAAVESDGKRAIRLGLAYGQDFRLPKHRALAIELVKYVQAEHVHVSWQCTSVAGFSNLNYTKHEWKRADMDRDREMVGNWINMYGDLHLVQHCAGRFCHGENPERSLAWLHPRFNYLPGLLWCVTDQCTYGLKSIRPPHNPLQKPTGIVTNSPQVQELFPRRCTGNHFHDRIEGSYKGVYISKAAENYPKPFARALYRCFLKSTCANAYAGLDEVPTEPSDHKHVLQYIRQLHVALGHASTASMTQVLKEAGANDWLVKAASDYQCPLCNAQKGTKPIPKVALKQSNAINDCVYLDFFFVRFKRGTDSFKACIMSLYDEATGLVQYHHINNAEPTTELTEKALESSWFPVFGPPKRLYTDDDRVFTSKTFGKFCRRYGIQLDLTASSAGHQHGSIEQLHHHARIAAKSAWAELAPEITLQSLLVELGAAHNDLAKHKSVSPNMLAFGQQRRDPPNFSSSGGFAPLADTLLRDDEAFQRLNAVRLAARMSYLKAEANARLDRAANHKSRPSAGPFLPGERVLVYRTKKLGSTRADEPDLSPKRGFWYGPAVVLATDTTDHDKLRPRLYFIAMFGRLYRCAEHQLKALPPSAELARRRLAEFQKNGAILVGNNGAQALRPDQQLKGTDISEEPEEDEPRDDEDPLDDNMPSPQGLPESFGPAAPPGEYPPPLHEPNPVPAVVPPAVLPAPVTEQPVRRKQLLDDFPVAALRQHNSDRARSRSPPGTTRALEPPVPEPAVPDEPMPSARKREATESSSESRPKAKQRAASVPPLAKSMSDEEISDEDFSNLDSAFYASPDHAYGAPAIEISLEFDAWELQLDDFDVNSILRHALLASKTTKRKLEVNERKLTPVEKDMFRAAKAKEWNSFVDNQVVELASRYGVDARRIIGSRWVLSWKKTDEGTQAKARLVMLGYQDPDLGDYTRSSPTLTRLGRHSVLQISAQYGWNIFSLDAKNAFLAGDLSSRSKALYMNVPKDLLEMLKLPPDTVFKLLKSAYGLAEAPIAWFRHLRRQLLDLGWIPHPLDECVFRLFDKGKLVGIIGLHVDDLLVAGTGSSFDRAMSLLESRLPFGARKYGKFMYCGLLIEQVNAHEITVDQSEYIDKLVPMPHKHLSDSKTIPSSEQTAFKGLCGGLSWAVINTRPDHAFDVSWLASRGLNATGADVAFGNKIMRAMKQKPMKLRFIKVGSNIADWCMVTFHDAGWATRPSLHSQAGGAIFLAESTVRDGSKPVRASLLDWICSKIERVVRSSFEAEINSAQIALDHMEYANAFVSMCLESLTASEYQKRKRSKTINPDRG